MDYHSSYHSMYVRRPIAARERIPASRWVREWVPQEIAATGKRIFLLKWVRGYFLNLAIQYLNNTANDNEVLSGFRHVVGRLEPDISKEFDIDREVEFFRMKVGAFGSDKAKLASKQLNPAEWWSIIARKTAPNLTRLAMRVLSQTVSSLNYERNWTTFSLIYTKTRNRLTMNNLKKLVYVHYNMRLRERNIKRKNCDDQTIDLDQIFYEDDPLAEWTCEVEDRLLDDRDNSWLDEEIPEETALDTGRRGHRSDKRKKAVTSEDNEDSDSPPPDEHSGGGNIGGVGVSGGGDSWRGSGGSWGGDGGDISGGGDVYGSGGRFDGGTYKVYQRGHGRDYHPSSRESNMHESQEQQYDYHGSYNPTDHAGHQYSDQSASSTSEVQPSPYDNLMVSFFEPSQMQYSYPSYQDTMQGDDDNEQYSNEPHQDMLKVLKDKFKEPEPEEPKPEPTTEILFLCSYEGCNKAFPNEGAYRKHAHVHGERQYACSYPGCGKKFLDSSKLKRHQVVHTGERNFICPHEGCGKAFNLDFNLKAHMKTHSQEHYHVCPYQDCDKRYTQECKLKSHIKAHHEKNTTMEMMKQTPPAQKLHNSLKTPPTIYASPSSDRPHVCPYEGCGKDYIHEYKLNLHLKTQHPGHNPEDSGRRTPAVDNTMEEASNQDTHKVKGVIAKNPKRNKPSLLHKMPPAKYQKSSPLALPSISVNKQQWPSQDTYEDDSEETEEERENFPEDNWRYRDVNGDDEETEDEE